MNSANNRCALVFVFCLGLPCAAHAEMAFSPLFWLYPASVFVFIPMVALVVLLRMGMSWRRGRLGGEWMIAALAAVTAGAVVLWAAADSTPPVLTPTNWPLIYLALVPLFAVWLRSWRSGFSSSGKRRVGQFSSDEEFFRAVNDLIAKLERKGQQSAAAMLREGFDRLNGLTDGWALFLNSIDGVLSARSKAFDTADRQTLNVIRAAVNNAVSRR